MKKLLILLVLIVAGTVCTSSLQAQDLKHYKKIVKELSSKKYQGRGYAKDGANMAGRYLVKEFEKAGVDEVNKNMPKPMTKEEYKDMMRHRRLLLRFRPFFTRNHHTVSGNCRPRIIIRKCHIF